MQCPKCGGRNTWLEFEEQDVIQRCLCGLLKYIVHVTEDGQTIMRAAVRPVQVTLPAKGTKIHRCLIAVLGRHPTEIHTGEVARDSGLHNKETSALLVALLARGLVQRIKERRGLVDGSTWKLTVRAESLLQANRALIRKTFYGGYKMALVIVVAKGDSFYANDIKCTITRIKSQNIFRVEVDKGTIIEAYEISADKRTEVLPGVFLSAGFRSNNGAKVVIEAPSNVKILREQLYNADK